MRKIFVVPAGSEKHFYDTIEHKRNVEEVKSFIGENDANELNKLYHGKGFIVWGAMNTGGASRYFQKMSEGDYLLMTMSGKIVLLAEISYKITNKDLAKYFWRTDNAGETWENIYFLINEKHVEVPMAKINKLLGYKENYFVQGLMSIESKRQEEFEKNYGDIYDVLLSLDQGRDIKEVEQAEEVKKLITLPEDEKEEKISEHTEIQWRLIRLGMAAGNDIWLPNNDQNKSFDGNSFKQFLLKEFQPGIDVPTYVKNIDTVWKYGYQIKSIFEIEHSTSIYSGLLRFSDLKALTPNTTYPMYIVAHRDRKLKVFDQIKRPTFAYFNMPQDVAFLDYDVIRDLDEKFSGKTTGFNEEVLKQAAAKVV